MSFRDRIDIAVARAIFCSPGWLVRLLTIRRPALDGVRLDPHTRLSLMLERLHPVRFFRLSPENARYAARVALLAVDDAGLSVARVENRCIPGPAGDIGVRMYWPEESAANAPALVYYHGGGFCVGDLDTHDSLCRRLCVLGDCVVVSVDYRLAPEHPFPAGVDDAHAAFRWVCEHANDLGIDARRIAIGGDSAGGCLATVVSGLTIDAGEASPCFQLLIYPATDIRSKGRWRKELQAGYNLDRNTLDWYDNHYVREDQYDDPRVSPTLRKDMSGLPPTLIVAAGFDLLREEGELYAKRLRAAGVPVEYRCHSDLIHAFANMGSLPKPRLAIVEMAERLRSALHDR